MKLSSLWHQVVLVSSLAIATIFASATSVKAESMTPSWQEANPVSTTAIVPTDLTGIESVASTEIDTADLNLFTETSTETAINPDEQPAPTSIDRSENQSAAPQPVAAIEERPELSIAQNASTTEATTELSAQGQSARRDAAAATSNSANDLVAQSQTPDESTLPESDNATDTIDRAQASNDSQNNQNDNRIAQAVDPGRATRSGPSYIGVGGNIGLGGETTLGEGSFAVISKIGLTDRFSARPGVVIGGDDPVILIPLTIDFPISSVAEAGELEVDAAPYVGGGIAISTGGSSVTRALVTAGVDIPVADRVTANAGVNFAFFDDTEVGIVLGVGYNF